MYRVLVIESSARQRGSVSRLLTAEFISHWKIAHPADRFQVRDLAREPLPHLDELLLGAWTTPVMAIALRKGAPSSVPIA